MNRRLTLKREVLQDISADDLAGIAGGDATIPQTWYSCLTYVSCAMLHTCWAPDTLLCINGE